MAMEIVIPKLGMTMTEGTLAEWLVAEGAEVDVDTPLFHLTTEKLDHEEVATTAGRVHHVVAAGATLPIGTVIGWILAPGEGPPDRAADLPRIEAVETVAPRGDRPEMAERSDRRLIASPAARALAVQLGIDLGSVTGTGPKGRIVLDDVHRARAATAPAAAVGTPSGSETVSPLVRRLAATTGVDLSAVQGSGPGGTITRADVERAAGAGVAGFVRDARGGDDADGRTSAPGTPPSAAPDDQDMRPQRAAASIPIAGMRKVIADRMRSSLQQMAQLTLTTEVNADALVSLRTQLIAEWAERGVRPSYTDLVLRSVAKALTRHPTLNAELRDGEIRLRPDIHVGLAVSLEPGPRTGPLGGLVVATLPNADQCSVQQIAQQTVRLATAARAGELSLDEITGSTFAVTTLGAHAVDAFTPIVNPPNVAILGVGGIRDGVRWDGDRPVKASVMTLSLTIDHRVVDGVPGARFLATVRELLEQPYRLLV